MDFSISEIKDYLRCRRMWNFRSINRLGLSSKNPIPNPHLYTGTLFHRILENQVFYGECPDIDKIIMDSEVEIEDNYRELIGTGLSDSEWENIREASRLAKILALNYFEFYGDKKPLDPLTYECAEITFKVEIPNSDHHFIGTIDGIAKSEKDKGQYWLIEHKTVGKSFPDVNTLRTDYQMLAYVWAFEKLTGTMPKGVIYDGTLKKQYKRKVFDLKEMFCRHKVLFSKRTIQRFELDLCAVTREMSDKDTNILPNFIWGGCFDCSFHDLCIGTQLGEDISFTIDSKYRKNSGYRTNRTEPITSLKL